MRKAIVAGAWAIFLAAIASFAAGGAKMKITSSAFQEGTNIPSNIPPQTSSIAEGSTPNGVQGTSDFGKSGYGGPCPPSGTHRYYFKIFALDRELDLPSSAKRGQLDAAMKGHVIAQGELMGRYSRKK